MNEEFLINQNSQDVVYYIYTEGRRMGPYNTHGIAVHTAEILGLTEAYQIVPSTTDGATILFG